jgi:hypothetical protein
MSVTAWPFRRIPATGVHATPWTWRRDGHEIVVDDFVDGWDSNTDLVVVRDLAIDLDAAQGTLGSASDIDLRVVGSWRSTRLPVSGTASAQVNSDGRATLRIEIPRGECGGSIRLQTRIFALGVSADPDDPFAPVSPGAELWCDDVVTIRLEGDEGRVPMDVVSFAARFPAWRNAPWHIEIGSIDDDVRASLRVYLNADIPLVTDAVTSASRPDAEHEQLRRELDVDLVATVVAAAVDDDAFCDALKVEPDSIAAFADRLINTIWKGAERATIRQSLRTMPGVYRADIRHALGLYPREGAGR